MMLISFRVFSSMSEKSFALSAETGITDAPAASAAAPVFISSSAVSSFTPPVVINGMCETGERMFLR